MTCNQLLEWWSIPREPGPQLGIYNPSSTATTFDTDLRALVFGHRPNLAYLNQRHASPVTISDSPTTWCRPIFPATPALANTVFRNIKIKLGWCLSRILDHKNRALFSPWTPTMPRSPSLPTTGNFTPRTSKNHPPKMPQMPPYKSANTMPTAFTGYLAAPSLRSGKPGSPCHRGHVGWFPHGLFHPRFPPHRPRLLRLVHNPVSLSSFASTTPDASPPPLAHCPQSVTLNSLQHEGRWKSHDRIPQRDQGVFQAQGSAFRPRLVSPPHVPTCNTDPNHLSSLRTVVLLPVLNFGLPTSCPVILNHCDDCRHRDDRGLAPVSAVY